MTQPPTVPTPSRLRAVALGLVAGVGGGAIWWLVEIGVNWALGGVVPWDAALTFLELDLAAGAVGGLIVGLVLAMTRSAATGASFALGLSVVYGLLRLWEPPGFFAEALFVLAGSVAAVIAVRIAGASGRGPLAFVHLAALVTFAVVFGTAVVGHVESTYFAFSEPSGIYQVALLAALPLAAVIVDRLLGLVLRGHALRFAVELAAVGVAALVWGHPMALAPIDERVVTAAPPPAGTPDVILISMDTTRADHMSTYGYARPTSPNLTALAADALTFPEAKSVAQWTVPGHASMLTGMYPSRHGAHYSGDWKAGPKIAGRTRVFPLAADKVTLAEMLRDRGYSTGGFVANFANLDRAFGFAQGFGRYEDSPGLLLRPMPHVVRFVQQFRPWFAKKPFRSAGELNAAALTWMDAQPPNRPAFVFLNWLEPHHWLAVPPYDAWAREIPTWRKWARKGLFTHAIPAKLAPDAKEFITASYDGQIALMDAYLGELIAELKRRGRYENALIIVTADHGELLGEHDQVGHGGRMMYEGLLRMPMVVKLPGADRPRGVVETPVQQVDVVPTVLAALGAPIPADVQGQPVRDVTHPAIAEEHINPEFVAHYGDVYDRALRVLYDGPWKLISSSRGQRLLFDLSRDRDENQDLSAAEPARTAAMQQRLDAIMASMGPSGPARAAAPPLDGDSVVRLERLEQFIE